MNITIDCKAFKTIIDKLSLLEASVKAQNAKYGLSRYMSEEEVIQITRLSKYSPCTYRRQGVLTGRKIQYLREEVEAYINDDTADKIYALKMQRKTKMAKP